MNDPPYPGQGTPLPEALNLDGQWVHEGRAFLFVSSSSGTQDQLLGLEDNDGTTAEGFDANVIAEKLGVSIASLLEINRLKQLRLVWSAIGTIGSARSTIRVEIQTPTTGIIFNVSRTFGGGRA